MYNKRKAIQNNSFINKNRPKLEDYNLTQSLVDTELSLYDKRQDKYQRLISKFENARLEFWWLIASIIFILYFLFDNKFFWITCFFIGCLCGISGILILFIFRIIVNIPLALMKRKSIGNNTVLDRYKRYKSDLFNYEAELIKRTQIKKETYWTSMNGHKFEHEIAKLYQKHGYSVHVTKGSGDGGVDIIMKKNKTTYYVQCKNHKKPISPATARDLYGTMISAGIEHGIIISPKGFSVNVRKFVNNKNIELIDIKRYFENG